MLEEVDPPAIRLDRIRPKSAVTTDLCANWRKHVFFGQISGQRRLTIALGKSLVSGDCISATPLSRCQ